MKPKKLCDALRESSPRKMIGSSYNSANRFSALRSNSRSTSRNRGNPRNRSRSNSFRRNLSNTQPQTSSYRNITMTKTEVDECAHDISVLSMTVTKIELDVSKLESPELKEILGGLAFAVRSLAKIQEKFLRQAAVEPEPVSQTPASFAEVAARSAWTPAQTNTQTGPQNRPPAQKTAGHPLARARLDSNPSKKRKNDDSAASDDPPLIRIENDTDEADRKYYRFKDVIRDCEKSTLIFNLNLGRYPIMDPKTMSNRAALALSAMAAAVENSQTSHPSEEARETIDDVIGIVKEVEFYGKQTKTYRNSRDPKSGAYCTLPMRYDFSDRDTRVRAEQILRDRCNVNCSTPYPLIVRECMKGAANALRAAFPGAVPRVNVDAYNFCLKLAYRPVGAKQFIWLDQSVPLPALALEVDLRKIPEDFRFDVALTPKTGGSPPAREKTPERASEASGTEPMEGANGSQS